MKGNGDGFIFTDSSGRIWTGTRGSSEDLDEVDSAGRRGIFGRVFGDGSIVLNDVALRSAVFLRSGSDVMDSLMSVFGDFIENLQRAGSGGDPPSVPSDVPPVETSAVMVFLQSIFGGRGTAVNVIPVLALGGIGIAVLLLTRKKKGITAKERYELQMELKRNDVHPSRRQYIKEVLNRGSW